MPRRVRLLALILVLIAGPIWADSATDLTGYVTTDQATTAKSKRTGPHQTGHLGVAVEVASGKLRISDIEKSSPADKSDLAVGDVITTIDGQKFIDRDAVRQYMAEKWPGQSVTIAVERGTKPLTAKISLTAPSNPLRDTSAPPPMIGVQLEESEYGVRITGVTPGSPAQMAGLKPGDVVRTMDGWATRSAEAVRNRLADHAPGDTVKVSFIREDKPLEVAVEVAAARLVEDMPTLSGWDDRNPRVFRDPVYKLAVIPIQFNDQKLNEKLPTSAWDSAVFSIGKYKDRSPTGQTVYGSVNDYYQEMSCGKFKIDGKVFDAVTVGKKRVEYTQTSNRWALQVEACDELLKREGDDVLKKYDGIFFIYAGSKVATQRGGIFWPHRSTFRYHNHAWPYFIVAEGGEKMSSISVISHEFGHMLGLPDLYGRPEAPEAADVGIWCSMSSGHGQDGRPLHFSAWCKEQLGWLKPVVIDPRVKQKLILNPVTGSDHECYKILLRSDGEEYLLLENRKKMGFDRELPAEGLLIWRVVNGRPILEEAHGITGPNAARKFLGSVPYPSSANTAFTPDTTPSSRPTLTGGWNVYITNIRKMPDGRIAFQIGYEYM
ncbi:MAG: M6 family metalloprotease domain-containing protein [Gemmataceae bacterium]